MRHTLWIVCAVLLFTACERNFDEIEDTDQRYVAFSFDVSEMFSNVLVESADGFSLGDNSGLDGRHRVRVTARCYDAAGELVDKTTVFTTLDGRPEMRIKHLDKNKEYRFLFLADVVEYYSDDNYFEVWYQLNDSKIDNFYMVTRERSDTAKYNLISKSYMALMPDNQEVVVQLSPITYNGYFVFTNMEGLNPFSCNYRSCAAFSVQDMKITYITTINHDIIPINGANTVIPFSATFADDVINFQVLWPPAPTNRILSDQNHKPFVVYVDCRSSSISDCVFY